MWVYPDFKSAIDFTRREFVSKALPVHSKFWQATDISKRPEAEMREIILYQFMVQVPANQFTLEDDIQPNMPWAEDHFQERVGRVPVNPGVTWEQWPWSNSADGHRDDSDAGPVMAPQDWGYLAGILDADGTIFIRNQGGRDRASVRVQVGQKDRAVVDRLHALFQVGTRTQVEANKTQVLNGVEYKQTMEWWITGATWEVRWLLRGALPYLTLKKELAVQALEIIERQHKEKPYKKLIRGQEWPAMFSHGYMERYWPKQFHGSATPGIRFLYGDLDDVVKLIAKDPLTRQAYLPVFFPEDTGAVHGERIPCSIGYHFLLREGRLHCTYQLRSCDLWRHFADDLYLTARLMQWVCEELVEHGVVCKPGLLSVHIASLHTFINDYHALAKSLPNPRA